LEDDEGDEQEERKMSTQLGDSVEFKPRYNAGNQCPICPL